MLQQVDLFVAHLLFKLSSLLFFVGFGWLFLDFLFLLLFFSHDCYLLSNLTNCQSGFPMSESIVGRWHMSKYSALSGNDISIERSENGGCF